MSLASQDAPTTAAEGGDQEGDQGGVFEVLNGVTYDVVLGSVISLALNDVSV